MKSNLEVVDTPSQFAEVVSFLVKRSVASALDTTLFSKKDAEMAIVL